MKTQMKLICILAFMFSLIAGMSMAATPTCSDLATNPTYGLAGNPIIIGPTAVLTPKAGSNAAYCQVNFTYSSRGYPGYPYAPTPPNNVQQVKIRVGLPLNDTDGGTGGDPTYGVGAWNGRTRGLGGGGCAGSVGSVTTATNAGYVGSSTDTGHPTNSVPYSGCGFPFIDDHTWNIGLIHDFIIDGITAQVHMAKAIAASYYGKAAYKNYWDGCSTGGRQGLALAQMHPEEIDGWLVGAPAVNWERFQTAQMWGQVVAKDMGLTPSGSTGPISAAKLNQTAASAVAACDGDDGVVDGLVNDPRTCAFRATANICGAPTAPATNCLTATEAAVIDTAWAGPRNSYGLKIFPGYPKTGSLGGMGATPPSTGEWQLRWNRQDATYDWHNVTMGTYQYEAEIGSTSAIGPFTDTMSVNLDPVRDNGKKILMWNGTADNSIMADNSVEYYKTVAAHYGNGTPDFGALQSWYRYFRAPNVGHCGGGTGPQPQNLFETMRTWVETGVAPDTILAKGGSMYGTSVPNRTRPLCPFPTTAIYKGTGSTEDASNFYCGGNLDSKDAICFGLITPYQEETQNQLQAYGKYNPATCNPNSKVPINKGTGNPAVSELFTGYNYFEPSDGDTP
jgi:hypothetical protein